MALSYTTLLQHEEYVTSQERGPDPRALTPKLARQYDVHNTSTRPAACVRLLLCCSKCTAFSS